MRYNCVGIILLGLFFDMVVGGWVLWEQDEFEVWFGGLWLKGFLKLIIGVLCKKIGMMCVVDFRYILLWYLLFLIRVYEKFSQNDYLFIVVFFCDLEVFLWDELFWNVGVVGYDCYRFEEVIEESLDFKWDCECIYYGIFLDGIQVGVCKRVVKQVKVLSQNFFWQYVYVFFVELNVGCVIFEVFGFGGLEWEEIWMKLKGCFWRDGGDVVYRERRERERK